MKNIFEFTFIPHMRFLGDFLGPNYEIVLFDTKTLLHIENPFDDSRLIGSPINNVEKRLLKEKEYERCDFVSNYRALSNCKEPLRSATFFIKDSESSLLGMMTIGYKVGEMIRMRNTINEIINGPQNNPQEEHRSELNFFESFNNSVNGMLSSIILDIVNQINAPPERLSVDEKMEIVKILDRKGTFLIKGSVPEVASVLSVSEATIYRYLNKPRKLR